MNTVVRKVYILLFSVGLLIPCGAFAFTFSQQLQKGVSGNEVIELQKALKADSFIYPEGLVTGYFGALTEKAVQRFQAKYGLVNSGTAASTGFGLTGPRTRAKLNEVFSLASISPTPPPPTGVNPSIPPLTTLNPPATTSILPNNQTPTVGGKGGGSSSQTTIIPEGFKQEPAGHIFSNNFPTPILKYTSMERGIIDGRNWKIYKFSVTNWTDYPNDMFALEPDNSIGAIQGLAPRTFVVSIANTGSSLSTWKYKKPEDLSNIQWEVSDTPDWAPPKTFQLKMIHRITPTNSSGAIIFSNVVDVPQSGDDAIPNLKISSVWSSGNRVYVSACNRSGGDASEFTFRATRLDMPQFTIEKVKTNGLKAGDCMSEPAGTIYDFGVESGRSYKFKGEIDIKNQVQESIETDNSIENLVTIIF